MADKVKKLTKHQKDYPRHKAIYEYEGEFKRNYAKALGNGIEEFLREAKKITKKK